MLDTTIRTARPSDRTGIYELNVVAFDSSAEAQLVDRLRAEASPVVELVARSGDELIGHICFSPVTIAGTSGLFMGLGPMSVAVASRGQGIGSTLVRDGLSECRMLGAAAVVVLGHTGFYPRFGFSPAANFDLICEYDVPKEYFMVVELVAGALANAIGTVKYHRAFAEV